MKFKYHVNMVWITSHLFNPEYKSTIVSLLNGEKKGYVTSKIPRGFKSRDFS